MTICSICNRMIDGQAGTSYDICPDCEIKLEIPEDFTLSMEAALSELPLVFLESVRCRYCGEHFIGLPIEGRCCDDCSSDLKEAFDV